MRTFLTSAAAALLTLAIAASAFPTSSPFSISPLRLEFDDAVRDSELEIRNTGQEPLDVQLRVESWAQDDRGEDVLSATDTIIVFPRIARVEAGASRIFRIAHRIPGPIESEYSYRLFAEELVSEEDAEALQFALQISIPVFVRSPDLAPALEIASSGVSDRTLDLVVENRGSATGRVGEIRATGLGEGTGEVFTAQGNGWYVLPGARRVFSVPLPDECGSATRLRVEAFLPEGSLTRTIAVDTNGCSDPSDGARLP